MFPGGMRRRPGRRISTGLRFLDHMLAQIAHHGGVSLTVEAHGDLDIDEHHTMEDVAIVLGEAIDRALGSKAGIGRYGFALPMDDCRALVLLDFGGASTSEWDAEFRRERVGDVRRRCSATFSTRSAAGTLQPADFGRGGTTTTRPRRSSRLSPVRCAWPWLAPASIRHTQQQRRTMIAVTDYDTGNLRSVANAHRASGPNSQSRPTPRCCGRRTGCSLPGVGEASSAMAKLRERGLDALIPT